MSDHDKRPHPGLEPKDKVPARSGWGFDFKYTEPQRRLPCIIGDMLVPASADDIPPIAPEALEAVRSGWERIDIDLGWVRAS